jgi:DNA-binding CsgD family transcriptional regulator
MVRFVSPVTDSGLFRLDDLTVDLRGDPSDLPASLPAAIGLRLGFLSEPVMSALRVAAVLGPSFSVADLGTVSGQRARWRRGRGGAGWRPHRGSAGKGVPARPDPPHALPRDAGQKIARLIAEGLSNPDIAGQMFLSRNTIQTHVSHILGKLSARSRAEIARAVPQR